MESNTRAEVEAGREYGISGLDEAEIDYGNTVVKYHEPNRELRLLDSDYEVLKGERMMLAEAFVSAFRYNEMKLYRHRSHPLKGDDWVQSRPGLVSKLTEAFSWVKVWEVREYINYHELDTKGYTAPVRDALTPDHKLEWEFHLVAGDGDLDSSNDSVWFCARIGRGDPSL